TAAGLLVDLDDAIWTRPTRPDEVALRPGAAEALAAARARGVVAGVAWLPGLSADDAAACADRLRALLGFDLEIASCRHPGGPPVCWCRKPPPRPGVGLGARLGLDPARTVHLGSGAPARLFAERLGMGFQDAEGFLRHNP